MNKYAKIGATFYGLWGVLHIIGGFSLVSAALTSGTVFLENFGGGAIIDAANAEAIFAFHGFNIAWIGLVVLVSAIKLNWNNSRVGYWFNAILAGFSDLGLLVFLMLPGHIAIAEGMIGIILFAIALVASTIALKKK